MRIDRATLGPLRKLGEGGSGDVYEIVGTGTVYKEFNATALANTDIRLWAEGSVAFWNSLSGPDRAELAGLAVWPTATVHDATGMVGVVMPLLPDLVFHDRVGKDGTVERQLNEIKWLLVDPQKIRGRFDIDLLSDELVRYELIGRSLEFLAWLHARGVCFGDVSHNNFVFALNPPRVLGIDADAVVTGPGTADPHGRHTPHYIPPEMRTTPAHDRIDEKVDVWKAATLALRALTPGQGAFQRRPVDLAMIVGQAPADVVDLLDRALGDDRDRRPTMAELAAAFLGHVARLSSPPVAVRLDILDRVLRSGTPLVIEWEFEGAEEIAVETPDGVRHALDPVQQARGVTLVAEASGLLAVHVSNRHGSSTFPLGPVHVYEVPDVKDVVPLPTPPTLPALPAPRLPRLSDLSVPQDPNGSTSGIEAQLAELRRRAAEVSATLSRLRLR